MITHAMEYFPSHWYRMQFKVTQLKEMLLSSSYTEDVTDKGFKNPALGLTKNNKLTHLYHTVEEHKLKDSGK